MKHGHYFVSLSGATDSDVRDTAGGKAELRRGKLKKFCPSCGKGRRPAPCGDCEPDGIFFPDYHLVRVSVARTEGMEENRRNWHSRS